LTGRRSTRAGTRPGHHRNFVEHDGGILDEYRVGEIVARGHSRHADACFAKCLLITLVLLYRDDEIDRLSGQVRQLAPDDGRWDSSGKRDHDPKRVTTQLNPRHDSRVEPYERTTGWQAAATPHPWVRPADALQSGPGGLSQQTTLFGPKPSID
jgi:hypothetical protein